MAITAAKRRSIPSSEFGLPGKGTGPEGKGPGSYPLDTEERARDALSRSSGNATPTEQATIRSKVQRMYPDIKVAHHGRGPGAHHAGGNLRAHHR